MRRTRTMGVKKGDSGKVRRLMLIKVNRLGK